MTSGYDPLTDAEQAAIVARVSPPHDRQAAAVVRAALVEAARTKADLLGALKRLERADGRRKGRAA